MHLLCFKNFLQFMAIKQYVASQKKTYKIGRLKVVLRKPGTLPTSKKKKKNGGKFFIEKPLVIRKG